MNFLEAVKCMKEGKRVTRGNKEFYVLLREKVDIIFERYDKGDCQQETSLKDVEATDWELVEEKKSLSDNMKVMSLKCDGKKVSEHPYYYETEVKQSLKEFIDWKLRNPNATDNEIKQKAKKIFGEGLVE